tara:strand:- start:23 stop:937 length:915 start_codon:yes stop_codon:yes gene_type:complete
MRILNEFLLEKEENIEEVEVSANEKGEEVKTTKTVKKPIKKTFVVKRPNRSLYDEAELFYGVKLSEGIKAGLLTRALLAKRFNNDGGILSDQEKDKFAGLYMGLFEKQASLQKLELKSFKDLTKDEEKEKESLIEELGSSREEIQEFEMAQASLFDQTAENRARNKTILWWVLNLAHEQEGDNYTKVFSGESYEEMIASYDRYEEEEDDFVDEMLKKFSYVVSFWFVTKAETQEQLNVLLSTADDDVMGLKAEESAEEVKEEVKEEDKKAEKKSKERPVKKAGSTKKTKVEESGVKKSKVEKEG